jgi:hypothetical protein
MQTTIVEFPEFIRRASDILSETEKQALIDYLSVYPHSGDIMKDTGGIRKLRWRYGGKGKSGGARVIYYHNERIPLYLLTIFGKNEKENLSKAERNDLAKLVDILLKTNRREL